jgi:predicted Rossmann fold nucleotide-binding protein DprA/Smf involved in DNA uptake
MKNMPRVAIIGSRDWSNRRKVQDLVHQLKQKFGTELTIVSGGCKTGADKFAKKFAIEMGVQYEEYNPAHTPKNLYSMMPDYYYNKTYHASQFIHRNDLIAKNSDYCIALIPKDADKATGTTHTIKRFKKLNKPVIIMT